MESINFNVRKYVCSPRTPSFSSVSSSSMGFLDDYPLSTGPAAPLRFVGVPFSWEQLPGIPKKSQFHHKKKESIHLLPLPPPLHPPSTSRKHHNVRKKSNVSMRDPFVAALLECSKEDDDDDCNDADHHNGHTQESSNLRSFRHNGVSSKALVRNVSDRFGFVNLYASCKRTSAVSESIVYLPRSSRVSRDHLVHRSSR